MALSMARKPSTKSGKTPNEKVQLSLPPATLKRLRIAAAELGQDLSEVVAELIDARFSGVHVRGMNSAEGSTRAGQGSAPDSDHSGPAASVKIPTMNRFSQIHTRATAPVDHALDGLSDDQS